MSYALDGYLRMMQDTVRVEAYTRAIAATVRRGDVVLDLGAGVGLLTLLALKAGARHVFAVDPNPWLAATAEVACANGFSGAVTSLALDAAQVQLPQHVDVLIADVRGPIPLGGTGPALMDLARTRFVTPGGRVIPMRDTVYVAPVSCPEGHQRVAAWRSPLGGADYSQLARLAANSMQVVSLAQDALLAAGQMLSIIDYTTCGSLGETDVSLRFEIERAGELTGLGVWFDAELAPGIGLSTHPSGPLTVYRHVHLPLYECYRLQPGDVVRADINVRFTGDAYAWMWTVAPRSADGSPIAPPEEHSTFRGSLFDLEDFRRRAAGYRPLRDAEAETQVFALQAMDGQTTLETIAARLLERFPERFESPAAALAYAAALSAQRSTR